MPTTARGFRYPLSSDVPNVPLDLQKLAEDTDAQYISSTAALRPAPARIGRTHYATDTGKTSFDLGTAWVADARLKDVGSAPGQLASGDSHTFSGGVTVQSDLIVRQGTAGQINHSIDGVGRPVMYWGTGTDASIYRSSAGVLKTGTLWAEGALIVSDGNYTIDAVASSLRLNSIGSIVFRTQGVQRLKVEGNGDKLVLGAADDTDLFRSSAAHVATSGNFVARPATAGQVQIGVGTSAPNIVFGNAGDTNLYRYAASGLTTDGSFLVGQQLVVRYAAGYVGPYTSNGVWATDAVAPKSYFRGTSGADLRIAYSDNAAGAYVPSIGISMASDALPGGVGFPIFQTRVAAGAAPEANNRFQIGFNGVLSWGAGGASALDVALYRSGASAIKTDGSFSAASYITAPSDERLKKNIATVAGGLGKVLALRGVEFDWKDEKRGKERKIGFIAQEVDKVIPGSAVEQDDGTFGVKQMDILPLLVEAIKELSMKVNAMERKNG